jgi:hypothetical protein
MDKAKWRRLLVGEFSFGRLLKSLVSIYLLFGVLVYFFADRLMFHPEASLPWTTKIPIKVRTPMA